MLQLLCSFKEFRFTGSSPRALKQCVAYGAFIRLWDLESQLRGCLPQEHANRKAISASHLEMLVYRCIT